MPIAQNHPHFPFTGSGRLGVTSPHHHNRARPGVRSNCTPGRRTPNPQKRRTAVDDQFFDALTTDLETYPDATFEGAPV